MAGSVRKSGVKEIPLSEVKDDLSRFLCEAERHDIVITRHEKPAGVLIGFKSEDDWFEYRLETIRDSFAASKRRARACVRDVVRAWKM
jgi:prevent-host-death family protein